VQHPRRALLAIVASVLGSSASLQDPTAAIAVGQPFPEIVLPTLAGEPLSIAALRGHKVILHVFASW